MYVGLPLQQCLASQLFNVPGWRWPSIVRSAISLWCGNPGPVGLEGWAVAARAPHYWSPVLLPSQWQEVGIVGMKNAIDVEYPIAEEPWGTVTHVAILGIQTVSEAIYLYYGPLENPVEIEKGDVFVFEVGALQIIFS